MKTLRILLLQVAVVLVSTVLSSSATLLIPWSQEEETSLKWELIPRNMTTKRRKLAAATIGNRFLVFGGFNGEHLSNVDMFNVETGIWKVLPPMPTPRDGCAAVAIEKHVYVAGGHDGVSFVKTVEMLDTETMRWISLPSMSTPRFGPCMAAVGNQLVVAGGKDESGLLKTVERFDVETQEWTTLPSMSTKQKFCAATVVEDRVYVFGTAAEVYHTRTQSWTTLPLTPFYRSRSRGAAVTVGKQIVLIGGYDQGHVLSSVDMFDTETQIWARLPSMTTKRQLCAAAFVKSDQIIVAGGYNHNEGNLNTTERLVLEDLVLPTPPEIPPLQFVLGKRQQKTVLKHWLREATTTKDKFLQKFDAANQRIYDAFKIKKEELERQLESVKKEEDYLFKVLKDNKDKWVKNLDDQVDDAQEMLDDLMARLDQLFMRTYDQQGRNYLPAHLACPITGKLMTDPVMAADGYTYEKTSIENLMARVPQGQDIRSPVNGDVLPYRMLVPNLAIQSLVQAFRERQEELLGYPTLEELFSKAIGSDQCIEDEATS